MSQLSILAALLVFVCAIAARPTDVTLNIGSSGDVNYNGNLRQLPVGSLNDVVDDALQKTGSNSVLPDNLYGADRLKRSTAVQNQGGVRYNGITIKLPESDGFANSLAASSTEKPRGKPVNRLTRIHIRIG